MSISTTATAASRTRYIITALLFVTGVVNYLDRTNLSITAPSLSGELQIDPITMGWLFSVFGWTYTALQVPGGWLADRVHPKVIYPLTILVWSAATLSLGFVAGVVSLFILRLAVGTFEAPTYIVNNRIVTTWFPEKERGSTIGIYISAQYVGLGFLTPVLVWMESTHGWRSVFILTGIIGLLVAALWALIYRDPMSFRGTNQAELDHIRAGGGVPDLSSKLTREQSERRAFSWADLGIVLSKKKLWGLYIGQFSYLASANFFLTWFPTYLVQYRHLDFIKAGFYASIPFLAGFSGVLVSGFMSDWMLRSGYSVSASRKTPVLTGIGLSVLITGAQFVDSPPLIIFFLALAFFGTGMASITWSYVSAIAPERLIGLTGGVFNLFGGLSSIVIPIAIGYLVKGGSFAPALALCSILAIVAALCYIFLVGRMDRVRE